jgi:hypothetical protein
MFDKKKISRVYFLIGLSFLLQVLLNFYIIPIEPVIKFLGIPYQPAMIFYVWAYLCTAVFAASLVLSFLVKFFPHNKASKFLIGRITGYMNVILTLFFATVFTMFSWPVVAVLFSKGKIVVEQFVSIYAFWYFSFEGLRALSRKPKVEVAGKKIEY